MVSGNMTIGHWASCPGFVSLQSTQGDREIDIYRFQISGLVHLYHGNSLSYGCL